MSGGGEKRVPDDDDDDDPICVKRAAVERAFAKYTAAIDKVEQCQRVLLVAESELHEQLTERTAEVQTVQAEWKHSLAVCEKIMEQREDNIVRFDVGGTAFATRAATLARHPQSFFGAYASGRWNTDQVVFLDRDPAIFQHVMHYLRHGDVDIDDMTKKERDALLRDAQEWMLTELVEKLQPPPSLPSFQVPNLVNGVRIAPRPSDVAPCMRKIGSRMVHGTHTWTLHYVVGANVCAGITCVDDARRYEAGVDAHYVNLSTGVDTDKQMAFGSPVPLPIHDNVFHFELNVDRSELRYGLNGSWTQRSVKVRSHQPWRWFFIFQHKTDGVTVVP